MIVLVFVICLLQQSIYNQYSEQGNHFAFKKEAEVNLQKIINKSKIPQNSNL